MIVLDIETSGIDRVKCGIWQIGALELENPKNQFSNGLSKPTSKREKEKPTQ